MPANTAAISFCESALQRQKAYCLEHEIFPSWPGLVDQFLARRSELSDAYDNIFESVRGCTLAADEFFDAILCAANVWGPDDISTMRQAKKRLEQINSRMSDVASELSELLCERDDIQNQHPFGANTHYHVIDLIIEAAKDNYLFQSWVQEDLKSRTSQFDMKYWPSIAQTIDVIAEDAAQAEIAVHGSVSAAALRSSRPSKADFCRALMARVGNCARANGGYLPDSFHLKDESWASLVNCVLNLDPDNIVDGAYMKRLRQRSRMQ